MSDNRTKSELIADAEEYGISTSGNKAALLDRVLAFELGTEPPEESVEEDSVDEVEPVEVSDEPQTPEPAPKPVVEAQEHVLVKMERNNPVYQTGGNTFSRQHPYAVVSAAEADRLVQQVGGFRVATPSEVKSYYA